MPSAGVICLDRAGAGLGHQLLIGGRCTSISNLILLGGKFVEAVQQQGRRVGGRGGRGSTFADATSAGSLCRVTNQAVTVARPFRSVRCPRS
jgi:hypothetical protein